MGGHYSVRFWDSNFSGFLTCSGSRRKHALFSLARSCSMRVCTLDAADCGISRSFLMHGKLTCGCYRHSIEPLKLDHSPPMNFHEHFLCTWPCVEEYSSA